VCTNPEFLERNEARWNSRLIPNGVDMTRFSMGAPRREDFGIPRGRPVVLMASALVPVKRVAAGIESISRIPDAHLVVAGDGNLRDEIDQLAARLLPGRFLRFTVKPEKMPDVYRSADVFLHLAEAESFGNVFIEAMACGLPVVGHDSARLRWIVGNNQFLTDTHDPQKVADAVRSALAAPATARAERVDRAAEFSLKSIGARYKAFFEALIAARN
jgi:glycosyltransferase involved in cell wall biosynthesis